MIKIGNKAFYMKSKILINTIFFKASPTSQLLMEYEDHLRNTLEKDSESYSLHTFEALLGRSMENLEQELHNLGPDFNPKASFLKKRGKKIL